MPFFIRLQSTIFNTFFSVVLSIHERRRVSSFCYNCCLTIDKTKPEQISQHNGTIHLCARDTFSRLLNHSTNFTSFFFCSLLEILCPKSFELRDHLMGIFHVKNVTRKIDPDFNSSIRINRWNTSKQPQTTTSKVADDLFTQSLHSILISINCGWIQLKGDKWL